ncbi:MAG: acyl--CoA ligase [Fuerstiella sp.]|nr:acyl--CoA ligase [Fuerstiella sp.]
MHTPDLAVNLSPDPILNAVDAYRGSILDLDNQRTVEADEFARARGILAGRLQYSGLHAGDRVLMAVGNGPQFIALLVAILQCGGSPVLTHALTPPAELKRTALKFGAKFVITDAWTEDETGEVLKNVVTESPKDWLNYLIAQIDESAPGFVGSYPVLHGVPLHQTSGTTGVPKLAVRPGVAAVAEATNYIGAIGIDHSDSIIVVSPMSHAYAYGMGVMVPIVSGANIITMRKFQPKLLFQAFSETRATILPAVPAMLDMLLFGAGDRLKHAPPKVFAAGAPLTERTATNFRRLSGRGVRPLYGTTETGGISVGITDQDTAVTGCVGPAMGAVDIQSRKHQESSFKKTEPPHTLWVRSPSMMAGYLAPDGINTSPVADGWFQTGDMCQIDVNQRIHLQGRIAEVINVGGMKVVPAEVEEVITQLPDVEEVKVYAGTSSSGMQFVKAAVVASKNLEDKAIRAHCSDQLIYYKRPSAIRLVDALPKTPSGKVILGELP